MPTATPTHRRPPTLRVFLRAASAFVLALLALSAAPAVAVIGGVPDGTAHPNVGMIVGLDSARNDFPVLLCTGTLVKPDVVLTAAHCVQRDNGPYTNLNYVITFSSTVALDETLFPLKPLDGIAGTPVPYAGYDNTINYRQAGRSEFVAEGADDVGLLRLAAPVSGVTPAMIVSAGSSERCHQKRAAGGTAASTTPMPCARASSTIDITLPCTCAREVGPVLPATSLVPAMMWTTAGCRSSTSARKRASICALVWPLMPRSSTSPAKNAGSRGFQPSVIESPMSTTRAAEGGGSAPFSCR